MKRFCKKLHLWMSLPCGIFISILCLTGGILVFQSELQELLNYDRYHIDIDEVKDEPLPLKKLVPMVHEAFPQWEMEAVWTRSDPTRTYHFDFETAKGTSVQVNPYTGEIVSIVFPGYDDFAFNDVFFPWVQGLHTRLLLRPSPGGFAWGSFIVDVATLIFFFIIVTGIIIWAPKKAKNIKERLTVNLKKGGFRFWYDLHLAGGILAAIFLLLMVLSGLDYAFNWYHNGLMALFGAGGEQPQVQQPVERQTLDLYNVEALQNAGKKLDMLMQQVKRDYPGVTGISFKYLGTGYVTRDGRTGTFSFDPITGEILDNSPLEDPSPADKLRSLIRYLHTGTWAGAFSKTLYLLAALIGTILPITGYYFYFRKKIRKSKSE